MRRPTFILLVALGVPVLAVSPAAAQFSQSFSPLVLVQGASADRAQSGAVVTSVDDREIALRVQAALFKDKRLSGLGLSVKSIDGTVELSGRAESQSQADRAVQLARAVPGVKSVTNEIRVN